VTEGSLEALLAEGRDAFERGDAEASRAAFEAALAQRESGEALEGLARALYLAVDYPASIEAHERAFAAYRDEGDALGAARAARILFWMNGQLYGDWAVADGWFARAERLLAPAGEGTLEHGWIEFMRANRQPYARRAPGFEAAVELGRRFGDADLEFAALGRLGEALVTLGRVEEGMLMLAESLTAICAGEVRDLNVLEGVFCAMFIACERVQDVTRAEEWVRAADDMIRRRGIVALGAHCRAHYGGILTAAGRWQEAETELDEAARIFGRGYLSKRAHVLTRLADLRVRQGRLEEAAVLLQGLEQRRDAARPLAALHHARGENALAREVLERRLSPAGAETPDDGPLLALLVDVCLAGGAVEDAAAAAERLAELARRFPSLYFEAAAALARGKVCLASGSGDAKACLHQALDAFSLAHMPVELARARLELARAVARERPEVAVAEAKAALEAFERMQAARDADAAAALLRSLGAAGRSAPSRGATLTRRETEVLELLAHGLSNAEIADRLFITTKTAEHHVGHVLAKLGLRNRAEAAAYATRTAAERPGAT
jgi:DNA-binding CsgD family transcriptional regulator